jgi:hypothetical protein
MRASLTTFQASILSFHSKITVVMRANIWEDLTYRKVKMLITYSLWNETAGEVHCILSAVFSLLKEKNTESELFYDWRFTANQFVFATSPLRLTTSNFIFQVNTCVHSPYVTSYLTRRLVSRLQMLVLASVVILRSESRGTHDHILLSHIRGSRVYIPPEHGGPVISPRE